MLRWDRSLCPCFAVLLATWCGHLLAIRCLMSSVKHTAQLIFPRWQINVLCSLGWCVASPSLLCLSACGSQPGGASAPSWLTWRDAGEVCQLGVPSLWLDGAAGDAAASLQPQNLSGDWSLLAAAHGSVSGIAIISIAWQACDTLIKVSDHCCTTDGWFAAALNHQGTSPSHREGAATGRGLFQRGVLRLGQGGKTRKGSCLLEGIRCSSECRAGITGSPACQTMLIGKTEGEKRSMN